MKRPIAFLFACSIISTAGVAQAADISGVTRPQRASEYDAVPSTLYIPTEAIPLTPTSMCSFPQGGGDNSGLGCVGGLAEAGDYVVPSTSEAVIEGVRTALAPYNVFVTTTRPPAYVPYMMLLPGEEESAEGTSRTCVGAGIDCDGPRRNDIGLTNGGTMNCSMPDPVQTALMAIGYMSGLENNDNPMDPMFYPPDFAAPATEFQDNCGTLVVTLDEKGEENLPVCVGAYHETHCDAQEGQINSHQELVGVYGEGPAVEDVTPPVIEAIGIEDGMVLPAGSDLPLTATVTDDSGFVFVRWTITNSSKAFLDFDTNGDGVVCKSHNSICEVEFVGNGVPYYQSEDGNYGAPELAPAGAIGGEFTITFEASDMQGNVAGEMITAVITVEGGSADTTGGPEETTGNDDNDDSNDDDDDDGNADDTTAGDDDDGGTPQDDDAGGCACNTNDATGGAALMLLGFVGFGLSRRRRV